MNWATIGVGAAAILYGVFTARARKKSPESFWKLKPMQEKLGKEAGHRLHLVCYTLIPIVVGILLVLAGVKGVSILE